MSVIPTATHRFRALFEADDSRVFRITFCDGDIFRLRLFSVVDPSIYGDADKWTAEVVEPVRGRHPKFEKLFHSGSGVDFVESDITEIFDETLQKVVYVA